MKKAYYLAIPVALLVTALVFQSFRSDNGTPDVKDFPISAFTSIEMDGAFNVEFTQSETVSAKVEAEAKDMESISVEVKNEVLRLKMDKNHNYKSIKLMVSAPHLKRVGIAGSGNFHSTNALTEPALSFSIAGSGNVETAVQTGEVKTDIAGSGNVKLDGATKTLKVDIAGSGNVKANTCIAEEVKVSIAGSGSAYVNVSNALNADVAGSGAIWYTGDPKTVKQDVSGSGSVKRKDN